MANKHIRYGNYVVHIVYTHTQGTLAHGHTLTHKRTGLKTETVKGERGSVDRSE